MLDFNHGNGLNVSPECRQDAQGLLQNDRNRRLSVSLAPDLTAKQPRSKSNFESYLYISTIHFEFVNIKRHTASWSIDAMNPVWY